MSTRQAWQRSITDDAGNLLTGVQISVFQQDGITPATIYSGLTDAAMANPFNTGVQTVARFYAEPGLYVVRAFKEGVGTQEWVNVDISGFSVRQDLPVPALEVLTRRVDRTILKNGPVATVFAAASDISVVSGAASIGVELAPNGKLAVKVNCTSASVIDFTLLAGQNFSGDAAVFMQGGKSSFIDSVTMRVYQSVSNNKQFFRQFNFTEGPLNNYKEQGGAITLHNTPLGWGASGNPDGTFAVERFRMTIVPSAGKTGSLWFFGASLSFKNRKSRLCVVVDDGYTSCAQIGAPAFIKAGVPCTLAVIPEAVDGLFSGYMKLPALQSLLSAGWAFVAHGTGAITSLPPGEAVSAIRNSVSWVRDRGLDVPFYDQCYVWPEAKFQNASGEMGYLDAVKSLGINIARGANPFNANNQANIDALTAFNRLACPIIGHSWAGTTAAEATNIANLVSQIDALSNNGQVDFFIMFHKFVPDSTPDADMSLSIRKSDLETLLAAISTNVSAGKLECVTMPDLAGNADNFITSL